MFATWRMYIRHMANIAAGRDPLTTLMEDKGHSVHSLALATFIPETTMRRRMADRDFTVSQMRSIADALEVAPGDILKAAVEHSRSAA